MVRKSEEQARRAPGIFSGVDDLQTRTFCQRSQLNSSGYPLLPPRALRIHCPCERSKAGEFADETKRAAPFNSVGTRCLFQHVQYTKYVDDVSGFRLDALPKSTGWRSGEVNIERQPESVDTDAGCCVIFIFGCQRELVVFCSSKSPIDLACFE